MGTPAAAALGSVAYGGAAGSPLDGPVDPFQGRLRRLWAVPLRWHLAALALILIALVPLVGTSSSFLSDEGAAVIQARSLASGKGWIVPHPMPAADPDGSRYPLVNSERGAHGFAPLAKHPVYSLLLAGADRLGGVAAMVLLSIAGTVAAAGLSAALASRLDPALGRPAVWAVGLASPLLFDGFLVMGHTLGAALAAASVLCAVVAIAERRPLVALAVFPCAAGAVLIRSEAVLFAGSLAVVTAVVALRSRSRLPALMVAGSAVAGALVARTVESAWLGRIVGRAATIAQPSPAAGGGFLRGRVDGFVMTWLLPDYKASYAVSLLLLGVVVASAMAVLAGRSAPHRHVRVVLPATLAAACALDALFVAPSTVVPGLLMAFPLLATGLLLLRRPLFRDAGAAVAAATSGLFALGVIATQYPTGGTGEWGGRYFALAIPVIVPVLLLAVHRHGLTLERVARRSAATSLVFCSLALAALSVTSIRSSHRSSGRFVRSVEAAQEMAGAGRPVVATWSAAARFAWPAYDRSPWLLTQDQDVAQLRQTLAGLGVDRFVFVTVDIDADRPLLVGLDVLSSAGPSDSGRRVLVVRESKPR